MRVIIALIGLLTAGVAEARPNQTFEMGVSTKITNVSVSTGALAIPMDASKPLQRFAIEIFNADDTDTIYCGFDTAVATATTQGTVGRPIAKESGLVWQIQHNVDIFCNAASAAGASGALAIVTQFGVKK